MKRYKILKREIKHEKELREMASAMGQMALEKQAAEYERRLDDLNHSHSLAQQRDAEFLKRETYDVGQKEFERWKLEMERKDAATTARLIQSQRLWALGITVGLGILGAVLRYFKV